MEENVSNKLEEGCMKTVIIIWLILGFFTSILVVAALMRSSQLSQDEGLVENYDDWEAKEVAQELYPQQAEP